MEVLGLIAGAGRLPVEMARAARARGCRVAAVALAGGADPALEELADVTWLRPGELAAAVDALLAAGARDAVLAGKVEKAALYGDPAAAGIDAAGSALLASLPDRSDETLLAGIARHLEARGIRLRDQTECAPALLGREGPVGETGFSAAQRSDVAFAWPLAKALAGLGVGQTVAVRDGAVLAVEAIEGTDAAIARAGRFAAGCVVVKVARSGFDPRFDVPTIGPDTVAALEKARAGALAYEADRTLVLARDELAARADAAGIAIAGVRDGRAPRP